MPSYKDDLKRHISNKMIIPFFIVILVSITNCDESSDNKYISKLPNNDKKVFLDTIARRILEEVPEIKSVETSAADGGDVLEAKLKAQSDFVQKILKQEVDSLKAKRQNNATIKKNDTVTNKTALELDTESSTPINQSVVVVVNNTRKASQVNQDNITTVQNHEATEHVDLTFRSHDEDDGAEINTKKNTPTNGKAENYEQFVPVKVKYDEEILNEEKISSKGSNRKREVMPDSVEKVQGAGVGLAKNKTRRKSHDMGNSSTTVTVKKTTSDGKVNNNEVLDVSTTSTLEEKTTETTIEINEVVSETLTESTIKAEPVTKTPPKSSKSRRRNLSNESESSEFLGENISVENKTEKEAETTVTNLNKTTTTEPNLNITNLPTSEDGKDNLTSIAPLTTTEASTSTTVRVENNPEKVSIMRNKDEPNNKIDNSTTANEPPTTSETLIGLTTTKKCDEKPCNQNKSEEKHEETETTVSTTKEVETTSVTNAPDAVSDSTSTKTITKLKTALRASKYADSKHSPKHMHFGDMQVTNAYEVYEVDPDTPAFVPQKLITERAEKVPVHIYDAEHAFYNPHDRLKSRPIQTQSVELSSVRETIEESLDVAPVLDLVYDGKRMIKVIHDLDPKKQTHPPYRIRPRLEALPNTQEEEHPFQIHKRGLKDSLKAVRGILYTNSMFGYVPTNHERELSLNSTCIYAPHNFRQDMMKKYIGYKSILRCQDLYVKRKKNMDDQWNSAREDTRDERHTNNKDKAYNSITDFLKRYMNQPKKSTKLDTETNVPNMSYDIYRNTVTINGVTYNLYDDKLKSLFGTKETSSQESDEVKTVENWLKTRKYKKKSKIQKDSVIIHGHKPNKLAEVLDVLQASNKWKPSEVSSEELKYLTTIDKQKSSEETSEVKKPLTAIIQQKMPQLKRKVKSYSNQELNPSKNKQNNLRFEASDGNFGKLDTIEKISIITPAIDLLENIDVMLAKNIKVTRTNDEDLELHLNILRDLVKMDNTALKQFDWLGTTVDIQAALRKLMDLTEKTINHRHIHPSDMNLLNYIQELYKKAADVLFEREEENRRNSEEATRVLNDDPMKHSRSFPKNGKIIRRPLKVLDHIWDMMNDQTAIHNELFRKIDKKLGRVQSTLSLDEEFFIFLYTIQNRVENFHEAIKQIASITTYTNQNWYMNIKDLVLTRAGTKEYLELLLHLFLTRFFDLIEENVMMGVNQDFEQFMKEKRAEVDRTEVELVFILKILKEIKQFK